jgi:hypothetical protein
MLFYLINANLVRKFIFLSGQCAQGGGFMGSISLFPNTWDDIKQYFMSNLVDTKHTAMKINFFKCSQILWKNEDFIDFSNEMKY